MQDNGESRSVIRSVSNTALSNNYNSTRSHQHYSAELIEFAITEVFERCTLDANDASRVRRAIRTVLDGDDGSLHSVAKDASLNADQLMPIYHCVMNLLGRGLKKLMEKFNKCVQIEAERTLKAEKKRKLGEKKQEKQKERQMQCEKRAEERKRVEQLVLCQKTLRGVGLTVGKRLKRRHSANQRLVKGPEKGRVTKRILPNNDVINRKKWSSAMFSQDDCIHVPKNLPLFFDEQLNVSDTIFSGPNAMTSSSRQVSSHRLVGKNKKESTSLQYIDSILKLSTDTKNELSMVSAKKTRVAKMSKKKAAAIVVPPLPDDQQEENDNLHSKSSGYLSPEKRRDVERWMRRSYGEAFGVGKENHEDFTPPPCPYTASTSLKHKDSHLINEDISIKCSSDYRKTTQTLEELTVKEEEVSMSKVSTGLEGSVALEHVGKSRATRSATVNPFRDVEQIYSRDQVDNAMCRAIAGAGLQTEFDTWKETMQLVFYDAGSGGSTVHSAAIKMHVPTRKLTDLLNSVTQILTVDLANNKRNSTGVAKRSAKANENAYIFDCKVEEMQQLEHYQLKTKEETSRQMGQRNSSRNIRKRSAQQHKQPYEEEGSMCSPRSDDDEDNGDMGYKPPRKIRRRRRLKKPIPAYWKEYPLVVDGILNKVMLRCADEELRKRLFDAQREFIFNDITIPDVIQKHGVVLTTFRRYFVHCRNALCDALGVRELCSILADFLKPTTSFAEFKQFFVRNSDEISQIHTEQLRADSLSKESDTPPTADGLKASSIVSSSGDDNELEDDKNVSHDIISPFINKNTYGKLTRHEFSGTTAELTDRVKSLIGSRHTGNVDALAEVIVFVITKEAQMREAMKKAGVNLEIVLAAYGLCNRHIAMDRIVITDDVKPTISPKKCSINAQLPVNAICSELINAFSTTQTDRQLKAVIDYVLIVGYKRADVERVHLIGCLEGEMIDGLSLEDVLKEHPTVRNVVASAYSKRCQSAYDFLSTNLPNLIEKISYVDSPRKTSDQQPIPCILEQLDADMIKSFLSELEAICRGTAKELAIHLVKRCHSVKSNPDSCVDEKFIMDWLHENMVICK